MSQSLPGRVRSPATNTRLDPAPGGNIYSLYSLALGLCLLTSLYVAKARS